VRRFFSLELRSPLNQYNDISNPWGIHKTNPIRPLEGFDIVPNSVMLDYGKLACFLYSVSDFPGIFPSRIE
jgi:hypothetical protein